jgi:hypothetical protein
MSQSVLAKVYWIPAEEGGRAFLPTGKKYATVSRFTEDADAGLQEAWSIVLEFDEPPSVQGNLSLARARFLVEQAPADRLKPGHAFELYEGKKKVARVSIIG